MSVHCTIPSEVVTYVSSPNARGTLDIIWSSLATLVLCTWTVNKNRLPERPPEMGKWEWVFCWFFIKSVQMVRNLLAPELLVGDALEEHLSINWSIERMKRQAKEDEVEWSRTHSYFADMGGFGIQKAPNSRIIDKVNRRMEELVEEAIHEIEQTGGSDRFRLFRNVRALKGNEWRLNTNQLFLARKRSIIASLPDIPAETMEDLSKMDALAQALTLGQIAWLIISVAFRFYEHLPVTQLEIAVLGFSVCAVIAYGLQWDKPKDVNIIFRETVGRDPKDAKELIDLGTLGPDLYTTFRNSFASEYAANFTYACLVGAALTGVVFGGIHLIAWNFAFPTDVEKRLWRAASLISVVVPIVILVLLKPDLRKLVAAHWWEDAGGSTGVRWWQSGSGVRWWQIAYIWTLMTFASIYVVARGYIIVETIRALFFLPPEAFSTTWTVNLPQIG